MPEGPSADGAAPAGADPTKPDPSRPDPARPGRRVQSVLFVCNFNAVRSACAEALARHYFGKSVYVQSAGVRGGEPADPFMIAALDEIGIDASRHRPRTLEELEEWEGLNFDLIVSLSPEAHHAALELTRTLAAEVEYWPTPDPTVGQGSREQRLDGYRDVRDGLGYRIRQRLR
ncbi:low molecular weight phosphatase family protein [Methylobacterium sp. IF7SW-B2]|nr:low molecular weight phosphatase family protein [Methylobacterium ajmalii]MBK3412065.1 low molecular weight phosphatase family protein [Methylobacterium ajmalii]MBK3424500.1 low molecular weight phosphatase family protein [Methylobacterium ajmalii]SEP14138.1 Protein-tyrosine-phosphatase [Methylobacterium sp. ap11]SFE39785.1 Protein-tyrosine-phosphatase [Methylobacterium sp. yr596]